MSTPPNNASASETTPDTEALSRACQVETIERNGFKAVVFRLHGNGYFSECLRELRDIVKRHRPQLNPDGTVSHYILFDLEDVGGISDPLVGVFIIGCRTNEKTPLPTTGLIHVSPNKQAVIELVRLDGWLPSFTDEQAAFDAMTPVGFPSAVSWIKAAKTGRIARQADLAETANCGVRPEPDASTLLAAPNVGQKPRTSDLAQNPPSVKQGTDEESPLTAAFVPANDPKQKLGVRQRAIFAAEWAAGFAIATVLCPFASPVFALVAALHILEGFRKMPRILKFPLGIVLTIVLIPVMLIPAWGIIALFGHDMVSTPTCRACGGKVLKDVRFITNKAVIEGMEGRELKIGEVVCGNCGKNFIDICS